MDKFQFPLLLGHDLFPFPRKHDRWLMNAFESAGYSSEECKSLNTVRLHQQVLFESDIFEEDERTVNSKYLQPRQRGIKWSSIRFGLQKPPPTAFSLWREAITQLVPGKTKPQARPIPPPPHTPSGTTITTRHPTQCPVWRMGTMPSFDNKRPLDELETHPILGTAQPLWRILHFTYVPPGFSPERRS